MGWFYRLGVSPVNWTQHPHCGRLQGLLVTTLAQDRIPSEWGISLFLLSSQLGWGWSSGLGHPSGQQGFPGDSDSKEPACNVGNLGLIPGLGIFPWRREWLPTPVFLPGKFHGQRSLPSYSPWGHSVRHSERLSLFQGNCICLG